MADELAKLNQKYQVSMDLLRRVAQQERSAAVTKHKVELVTGELGALPDDTRMFKQLGKAYFLVAKSKLISDGEAEVKAATVEQETCRSKRTTIEAKVQDAKLELMEAMKAL